MAVAVNYRKVALLAVLALVVVFRRPVLAAVLPFLVAFVLAHLIDPAVNSLQRRLRFPRPVATSVTLVLLVVVVGGALVWVATNVYNELLDLATLLPAHQRTAMRVANDLLQSIEELFQSVPEEVTAYLRESLNSLSQGFMEFVANLTNRLLGTVAALPSAAAIWVIIMLATYFFSTDRETVNNTLLRLAPAHWRPRIADARDKVLVDLGGFLRAQVVMLFISTTIAAVGLVLIGTRYWMVLSLILGILDVIPVLGPGLLLFPWAGISLFLGNLPQAVQLVGIFLVMFAARNLLQAKVLGDSVGMHPLLMLIALWVGIVVFGVYGILIGPILAIIAKALANAGIIPLPGRDG
ncbi:MAG: sporulation integral membrane protein YtvI [Firmicutes bacterium ZCTH02-B6]|nr:MAG: sporulation integral membrane protein YtvI [Firmicutes bacterium ZCTH02-B6]